MPWGKLSAETCQGICDAVPVDSWNTKAAEWFSYFVIACESVMFENNPEQCRLFFLSHLCAQSYGRRECQMPPTDMCMILKAVGFEIMTSFVCLIHSTHNNSLSMSFTLTGYLVSVCLLYVCVYIPLPHGCAWVRCAACGNVCIQFSGQRASGRGH